MRYYSAALAAGALVLAAAGPASAAKSDLNGVWLPTDRNILIVARPRNREVAPGDAQGGGGAAGGAQRGGGGRGGAPPPGTIPPYKPDWAARYQATVADSRVGKITVDPTAKCLPPGMPRAMTTIFPIEFSVEPNRVLMLFEIGGVRWVWTDGRKHPSADDLEPTFMGDSIGHWEGDTLVVDTVGLREDTVFDASGAQHSDKMHVVERIRLLSPDKLEDRITVDDPVAFTKPWEATHTYDRKRGWQIMEYICEENNRGINPDGSDAPGK
ncbi:MAG: hypothetical protein JWO72_1245 [Caulobacteraceae bacterium]|nr:hypothetical protein [Caulobacteraceae bacterium]